MLLLLSLMLLILIIQNNVTKHVKSKWCLLKGDLEFTCDVVTSYDDSPFKWEIKTTLPDPGLPLVRASPSRHLTASGSCVKLQFPGETLAPVCHSVTKSFWGSTKPRRPTKKASERGEVRSLRFDGGRKGCTPSSSIDFNNGSYG